MSGVVQQAGRTLSRRWHLLTNPLRARSTASISSESRREPRAGNEKLREVLSRSINVANVRSECTENDLIEWASRVGAVCPQVGVTANSHGTLSPTCRITFTTPAEARMAAKHLDKTLIRGSAVSVMHSRVFDELLSIDIGKLLPPVGKQVADMPQPLAYADLAHQESCCDEETEARTRVMLSKVPDYFDNHLVRILASKFGLLRQLRRVHTSAGVPTDSFELTFEDRASAVDAARGLDQFEVYHSTLEAALEVLD
mmetsp:Transcript_6881/g.20932  ORF Transcript_6881/g.20932 Transcript_6881/m.20932 type:complete len:256 (+) Transcript_6881:322-1089(+)